MALPFPFDLHQIHQFGVINRRSIDTTYHFFFCFFAPVAAGAMVNVDVWNVEMS